MKEFWMNCKGRSVSFKAHCHDRHGLFLQDGGVSLAVQFCSGSSAPENACDIDIGNDSVVTI